MRVSTLILAIRTSSSIQQALPIQITVLSYGIATIVASSIPPALPTHPTVSTSTQASATTYPTQQATQVQVTEYMFSHPLSPLS